MSRGKFFKVILNNRIIFILLLLVIVVTALDRKFVDPRNLINLLTHISINGIMALGMTVLLVSGSFDLSIGSVLSLSGLIAVGLQPVVGVNYSIILALLAGVLIGLLNGVLVTYGRINAFIATLGTLILFKGVSLSINKGWPISGKIESFTKIGLGTIGPIPLPIIYFIILTIIFWFIMKYTFFGRNIYAIGGNELAARISGIKVNIYKVLYFVLCSFCASFSGIVLSSRLNTGSPVFGDATPLIVIAAVILGGTSLAGGVGTIRGTILGILIIGSIENGMNLLNIWSYYQIIIKGSVLITVVLIDAYYAKLRLINKID